MKCVSVGGFVCVYEYVCECGKNVCMLVYVGR